MTPAQEYRLKRLARRATRYELAVTFAGTSYLLQYSYRCSRGKILESWMRHTPVEYRAALIDQLGINGDSPFGYTRAGGWEIGPLRLHFTGRTERNAILLGELQPISEVEVVRLDGSGTNRRGMT